MTRIASCLSAIVLLGAVAQVHGAQMPAYPERPIRFILPFQAGGVTDTVARSFGQKLGDALGQQLVADNRGGAAGIVACELAARANPDGYTLLLATIGTQAINPHIYSKLPYNPFRDFAPISQLTSTPYVLIIPNNVPAKSVKELIAYAKSRPKALNFASGGVGTGNHLSSELFNLRAGLDVVHVPYKGASLAINDIISGSIQMMFLNLLPALPHINSARVRGLAVTSAKRSAAAAELPTVAEAGLPGFETSSWHGIVAPAKTPKGIVDRLYKELAGIAQQRDMQARMAAQGTDIVASSPQAFAAKIKSEHEKWGQVVRKAGIKAN